MCSGILEKAAITGSAKGAQGWFPLVEANVSYDHPTHANLEHGLIIDFMNEEMGPGARVAVELSHDSAQALVRAILDAMQKGEEL